MKWMLALSIMSALVASSPIQAEAQVGESRKGHRGMHAVNCSRDVVISTSSESRSTESSSSSSSNGRRGS